MAVTTAAVVGTAATVGSAVSSRNAARSAQRSQERSADASLAESQRQFDIANELQRPFREFGESFLPDLDALLRGDVDILDDPTLQPQLDDATRTINNRASQAGKFYQPRTVEALLETRDNIIRESRGQRLDELFAAVDRGQATAVNQAAGATQFARDQADLLTQRGNASAAGAIASANATNDAIAGVATGIGDIASSIEDQRTTGVAPPPQAG